MKNDDLIVKMIDEIKENNDKEHKKIEEKFGKLEEKIDDLK